MITLVLSLTDTQQIPLYRASMSVALDRDLNYVDGNVTPAQVADRVPVGTSISLPANDDTAALLPTSLGYSITVTASWTDTSSRGPVQKSWESKFSLTSADVSPVSLASKADSLPIPGAYISYAQYVAGGYADHGNVTGTVALDSTIGTHTLTLTGDATATINDTAPNGMVVGIYAACAGHTLTVQDSTQATLGTLTGTTGLSTMVLSRIRDAWLLAAGGSATPPAPPASPTVPTSLATSAITAKGFTLSWAASTDPNGAAITYQVASTPAGGTRSPWAAVPSGTSYALTGLSGGITYTISLRATSSGGVSAAATTTATTTAPPQTMAQAVAAASPLFYVPLTDAAGTTSPANTGSTSLALTATGVTFGATPIGSLPSSAAFDGTTSKIISAAVRHELDGATAFSTSYVLKGIVDNGAPSLAGQYDSSLSLTWKVFIQGQVTSSTPGRVFGPYIVNNTPYHIVITVDTVANVSKLWINGTLMDTGTAALAPGTVSSSPIYIGYYGSFGNFFTGNLAALAVWNRALTTAEVASIAQASGLKP